ncbi:MAG: MarR family transcriptional regulator [Thermoleophilia bacterium]|nr:MarR family transcriptional regulator [Thermoleophilia bacterium]
MGTWTFITNHARVLLVIARDPTLRLRDIAATLDITERAAQRIVTELVDEGYLTRKREGRRNSYKVHPKMPMRAPQAKHTEVGEILDVLLANQDPLDSPG